MNSASHGLLRPYSAAFSLLVRFADAAIIWLTLYGVMRFIEVYESPPYKYASLLAIIFFFITAEFTSTFQSSRLENFADIAGKVIFAWALTCIALFFISFITKSSQEFSRLAILSWLLITPVLLTIERMVIFFALHHLRSQFSNTRSYAILGSSAHTLSLAKQIEESSWTGLQLVGKYDDLPTLLAQMESQSIDYIFLCYPGDAQEKIIAAITALNDSTASTYLVPNLLQSDLLGSRWIMLGNTPLIVINDHPFYGGWWLLKKMEDIVLGALILLLILPIMLVIALVIKLTSPGPVLFKQRRHGLNGEVIKVYKFRTMTALDDGDIVVQASKNDPRITSIGKFLRRYSLDELPQFINVLQGTMSIVGPRPHAVAHNEYYRALINGYMQRHKVKPGITGWAQVNGLRGETDTIDKMQARVEYDTYYINHWSIGFDLKIILLTILIGANDKSAY
jgi:putative colanic acid biosysnthesis UDP-glucose lipid carrier transferase